MAERVVLYGATGYTGRRTAQELKRLGADLVIAGRSRDRLEALRDRLGEAEVRVADASGSLESLAEQASVLISTVGPFERYGEAAVAEAIRAGAHFCDTTGEQGYMQRVLERFDKDARDKGVTILNAQALEFAVSYCLSAVLLRKFPDTHTIDVFNRAVGMRPSRGTKQSALGAGTGAALVLKDGKLVDRGPSPMPMKVEWPDGKTRYAAPFPGGEALHLPRIAPSLRNVTTNLVLPTPAAWAMTSLFSARPALRALQKTSLWKRIDRKIEEGPVGPPDEEAKRAKWSVLVRALGSYGERIAWAEGTDVYGISGTLAALSGTLLAEGQARTAGVVSTGEAFDPVNYLDRLRERGVTYKV